MAIIPIANQSQVLEAGNPVPIGSSESARLTGEALAGLGKAAFDLGNALDKEGKKQKSERDRLTVQQAVNAAKMTMLEKQAQQNALAVQPEDRPDGFSAVQRFGEQVNPALDNIASKLDDDKQRQMFRASIGEDMVTSSTKVLASEIDKRGRENGVKLQEVLNGYSSLARTDLANTPDSLGKAEQTIAQTTLIPESQKNEALYKAKQNIVKEAIGGLIDRGNNGDPKAWDTARAVLTKDFASQFSSDELDKEVKDVGEAERSYYTQEWQKYNRQNMLDERNFKANERNAKAEYIAQLNVAQNDQNQINSVHKKVMSDSRLSPEMQQRLVSIGTFKEVSDDNYERVKLTKYFKTGQTDSMIEEINNDFVSGKVSADRSEKMIQNLQRLQERQRTNPIILKTIDQGRDEINNYKKAPTLDPIQGIYKQENDVYNERAQSEYMQRVAGAPNLTAGQIFGIKNDVLKKYYGVQQIDPVEGLSPDSYSDLKKLDDAAKSLMQNYQKGMYDTPDKKKRVKQQLKGLKSAKDKLKAKEDAKIIPMSQGGTKIYDE